MKTQLELAYDRNDSEASDQHENKIIGLFDEHKYNDAYEQYMRDPNGGARSGRENTTLKQFCEEFLAVKDGQLPGNKFIITRSCSDNALPVSGVPGFGGDDYTTLVALVNLAGVYETGQSFHVSHEGYEFECIMVNDDLDEDPDPDPDPDTESLSYNAVLKVTPFDWINAAQTLGYDIHQLSKGRWCITKDNIHRTSVYKTPAEAAKSICLHFDDVNRSEIAPQPIIVCDDSREEAQFSL